MIDIKLVKSIFIFPTFIICLHKGSCIEIEVKLPKVTDNLPEHINPQ